MKSKKLYALLLAFVLVLTSVLTLALTACDGGGKDGPGDEPELTVASIALDTSNVKTEFDFGEEFTYEGLKVTATMSDGSTQDVALADCRINTPSMTSAGQRRVTVAYGGKSAQYTITIKERVIPDISGTPLAEIAGENENAPYRVEAEKIDMETPGAELAEGADSFVASAPDGGEVVISGDKYLTGFGVKGNYFGFTFTADKEYTGVTLVMRVAANGAEGVAMSDSMNVHLNYAADEETHGLIAMDGIFVEAGEHNWADVVIRDMTIPAGTNELTFDILAENVPDIDYIDFYVGARYISSVVELTAKTEEGAPVVKDIENFDTEKARTREDVAAANGLKDGELFRENVMEKNPAQGANTSGGWAVGAIAKGSQLSTTIRLAEDATVEIGINCASISNYYVKDNWSFSIDGYTLNGVESKDIIGGSSNMEYWAWQTTSLGTYNLPAGDHLFLVNITGTDCNVDCINFNVLSYGSFDESGVDLDKQPQPVPEPEASLSKNGVVRLEAESLRYQDGWILRDDQTSFTENWNNDMGSGVCLKGFTAESEIKAVVQVEEKTTVAISFMMSYYDADTFDFSQSVIKFGDQTLTATPEGDFGHRDATDYWKWNKVDLSPVEVEAGVYTLSIVFGDKGMNLDYFEFVGGDGSDAEPEEPAVDAVLKIGETAKAEAESLLDQTGWVLRSDLAAAGMSFTENWSNDMGSGVNVRGLAAGSVVKVTVRVDEKATIRISSSMSYYDAETYDFAAKATIQFGETALTATPADDFGHRSEGDWWKWVDVDFGSVTVDAGTYTFSITFAENGLNVDYFQFAVTAAA